MVTRATYFGTQSPTGRRSSVSRSGKRATVGKASPTIAAAEKETGTGTSTTFKGEATGTAVKTVTKTGEVKETVKAGKDVQSTTTSKGVSIQARRPAQRPSPTYRTYEKGAYVQSTEKALLTKYAQDIKARQQRELFMSQGEQRQSRQIEQREPMSREPMSYAEPPKKEPAYKTVQTMSTPYIKEHPEGQIQNITDAETGLPAIAGKPTTVKNKLGIETQTVQASVYEAPKEKSVWGKTKEKYLDIESKIIPQPTYKYYKAEKKVSQFIPLYETTVKGRDLLIAAAAKPLLMVSGKETITAAAKDYKTEEKLIYTELREKPLTTGIELGAAYVSGVAFGSVIKGVSTSGKIVKGSTQGQKFLKGALPILGATYLGSAAYGYTKAENKPAYVVKEGLGFAAFTAGAKTGFKFTPSKKPKITIEKLNVQEGIEVSSPEAIAHSVKGVSFIKRGKQKFVIEATIQEQYTPYKERTDILQMSGRKIMKTYEVKSIQQPTQQKVKYTKSPTELVAIRDGKPIYDKVIYKTPAPKKGVAGTFFHSDRIEIHPENIKLGKTKQTAAHEMLHQRDFRRNWELGVKEWKALPKKRRVQIGKEFKRLGYDSSRYPREYYAYATQESFAEGLTLKPAQKVKSIKPYEIGSYTKAKDPLMTTTTETKGLVALKKGESTGKFLTKTKTRTPSGEFQYQETGEKISTREVYREGDRGVYFGAGEIILFKKGKEIPLGKFSGVSKTRRIGDLGEATYSHLSSRSLDISRTGAKPIRAEPMLIKETTVKKAAFDEWKGGTRGTEPRTITNVAEIRGEKLSMFLLKESKVLEVKGSRGIQLLKSEIKMEVGKLRPSSAKLTMIGRLPSSKIKQTSITEVKTEQKQIGIQKPISQFKPITMNELLSQQKQTQITKTIQATKTTPTTKTIQASKSITGYKPIYATKTTQASKSIAGLQFTTPPPPPPTTPLFPEFFRGKKKKKGTEKKTIKKQLDLYTPSIEAELFGLYAKKKPIGYRSGLIARPILR